MTVGTFVVSKRRPSSTDRPIENGQRGMHGSWTPAVGRVTVVVLDSVHSTAVIISLSAELVSMPLNAKNRNREHMFENTPKARPFKNGKRKPAALKKSCTKALAPAAVGPVSSLPSRHWCGRGRSAAPGPPGREHRPPVRSCGGATHATCKVEPCLYPDPDPDPDPDLDPELGPIRTWIRIRTRNWT